MSFDEQHEVASVGGSAHPSFEVDVTSLSSAVLARLVSEVKNDDAAMSRSYDRVHNRHNR